MQQSYLTQLTPHVFWSPPDPARDRPIMGAITGQRCTLIVEAGASPAHAIQFLNGLEELGGSRRPAPARYAAVTHWHWDHVFGAATLGLPVISHVETRKRILEMARLDWRDNALNTRVAAGRELAFIADQVKVEMTNAERGALTIATPEVTFTVQVEVDLGELSVQIFHVGGDHSPDSSVIYAPEDGVAFLGDCVYNGFIGAETFYTLPRLLPLLDRLEGLPARYYVPAHHPAPLPRDEFLRETSRIRQIGELVDRLGGDREACLAQLPAALNGPVTEDDLSDLNSFLRGLEEDVAQEGKPYDLVAGVG
jgi:glyoxylase-like metal-dependent hydrolase (beta-lactamase superfamily II)